MTTCCTTTVRLATALAISVAISFGAAAQQDPLPSTLNPVRPAVPQVRRFTPPAAPQVQPQAQAAPDAASGGFRLDVRRFPALVRDGFEVKSVVPWGEYHLLYMQKAGRLYVCPVRPNEFFPRTPVGRNNETVECVFAVSEGR